MNIPNKVKIGGSIFDVVVTDKNLVIGDKANHSGIIHYSDSLIEISDSAKGTYRNQVFLHEVLHGIAFDRGINLGEKEEEFIDKFAFGLLALIADNPEIFKAGDSE